MRRSLVSRFHEIWIDNMHGNRLASERAPSGESCETLFSVAGGGSGIKVGTAISTFVKRSAKHPYSANVHYRDFWGNAESKRAALLASLDLRGMTLKQRAEAVLRPEGPREFESFVPTEANQWKLTPLITEGGYESWPSLDELFSSTFQGVNPNRGIEGSLIDTDRSVLRARMSDYFSDMPFERLKHAYPELCEPRARFEPEFVRNELRRRSGFREERIIPYVLFPLDARWIYFEPEGKLINEKRLDYWRNLTANEFLVAVPQPRRVSEARPLFATGLVDLHLHDRGSVCFPATVRPATSPDDLFELGADVPEANLAEPVWTALSKAWKLHGSRTDDAASTLVSDLFRVALAILHAPAYEADHAEALAQDWARLPIPKDRKLFNEVAKAGAKLRILLDPMADARPAITELLGKDSKSLAVVSHTEDRAIRTEDLALTITYYGSAKGRWIPRESAAREAARPVWGDRTGDLFLNDHVCLRNVPSKVWAYELGGYPVLKKWLGYREARRRDGNPLTLAEVEHLRSMVHRIAAIMVLHPTLDGIYERSATNCFTTGELVGEP